MASKKHLLWLSMCAALTIVSAPGVRAGSESPTKPAETGAADSTAGVTTTVASTQSDSVAAVAPPFAVTTVTADTTTIADSSNGAVTVVTTVTTITRVARAPKAASPADGVAPPLPSLAPFGPQPEPEPGTSSSPPAEPELVSSAPDSGMAAIPLPVPTADSVVAPASEVAAVPAVADSAAVPASVAEAVKPAAELAAPAVTEGKIAPVVPGPRIALISNGADPSIVANVKQMLEQGGASVDVLPMNAPASLSPTSSGVPAATASVNASAAALPSRAASPGAPSPAALPIAWEGQLRYRYEARTLLDYRLPGTFGRAGTQTLAERGDLSIMRTRVGATVRMAPQVRGYFVLQDARTMGAEGSPSGTLANVDLYHAYVDLDSVGQHPLSVRVGRQTLAYGEGRVVSGADWGNAGRAYDGARVRWTPARLQIDGFVSWISEGRLIGQDRLLSGVDGLFKSKRGHELEAYHFRRSFGDASWTSESGRKGALMDATSGLRVRVLQPRFDVRAEAATQNGQRASDAVRAWFFVGRMTADLRGAWKTKVFGEYLRATGDEDPADGAFQRFDPVYWGGHSFQGALDVAGASNLRDQCAGISTTPAKGWTLQAEGHVFRLDQARDVWVDDAGTTLRRSSAGTAGHTLGRELDASLRWDTRGKVSVLAGASRFWAGDYVRNTGGGTDLNWGYLQLAVGF